MDLGRPDLELDFLSTVFDVARIGICVIDESGRFVRVNPAFCELVRYPAEDLIGREYAICAPPSIAQVSAKFLDAVMADSSKIPNEWQIRRSDDSLFDALVSFRSVLRTDGRYAVITFSDITESKQAKHDLEALNLGLERRIVERTAELTANLDALKAAEEALREDIAVRKRLEAEATDSERKYRRVINLTREGFWLINARNETIEVNAALCEMLDYGEAEMLGRTPLDFVDDATRHILASRLVPAPTPAEASYEVTLLKRDGTHMAAAYNATAVINAQGAREFSFAFITDITERKRLEDELQRTSSERLAILENSIVGIAFVRERRFVWLNKAFEQDMLAFSEGALVGRSVQTIYADRDTYEQMGRTINAALSEHGVFQTENHVRRSDAEMLWCLVSGRALDRSDLSLGTIWTIVDITQRKGAEAEALQALEREKELSELKSRFVSMTSHEFRTPLAAIMSSIELMSDYADRLGADERSELVGVIKSSVKRMTQMLEEVLLIGKADAGRLEFQPQLVDVRRLCAEILEEVRTDGELRPPIALIWEADGERRRLDERLLRHVLINLLTNAVKYSPRADAIEMRIASSARELIFTVADRGIGIAPEDRPLLFQSFHRGRNVGNISGTGLGLAIVKKAVDLHGGRIDVDSELGRGSRFTVFIPCVATQADG